MELKKYLESADSDLLAKAAGTKPVYLTHLALGFSRASPKLAIRIEKATKGAVSRHDLRADIFGKAA